jgi:hypothetical protein
MNNPDFEERGKIFTRVVNKVPVNVIIQTTAQLIHGKIHVMPEERLSDELNREEKFLPVTNAVIYSLDGEVLYEANFLSINRNQITWIIPAADLLKPLPK